MDYNKLQQYNLIDEKQIDIKNIKKMQKQKLKILKKESNQIKFDSTEIMDLQRASKINHIFDFLKDKVLLAANVQQLDANFSMSLFNPVSQTNSLFIQKRKIRSQAYSNLYKVTYQFSDDQVDEAKQYLRQGVVDVMNNGWIINMSMKSGIQAKYKEDFYRFLVFFKQQLNEGVILKKINFKKISQIPLRWETD